MSKKIEQRSQAYHEKVAMNILESISDAVITTDLDFHIVSWNKAAENIYGWTFEEVIGKKVGDILAQNSGKKEIAEMAKQLEKQGFWKGDVMQSKQNGKQIYITSAVSVVKDDAGKPIRIVAVNRDITERIQLERRKDEFLGIASHELRTPLTSIKGYIQILERLIKSRSSSDKVMSFLRRTDTYTDKLNGLINDLLDVSKIQAGKMVLNKSRFQVDELIRESIDSIQPTSEKHQILYKNKIKTAIVADRDRIEQVITNLLSNAIKYSPKANKILVYSEKKNDKVSIVVQDFGIGIPKDKQSLLFQRYYRVEDTEKIFSGMGIGLYISSEIVKRHSGVILVRSEGKGGTTFEVILPTRS